MKKHIKILCIFLVLITVFTSSAFAEITDAQIPVTAEEAELKWSLKLGTNYRNAPSVPTADGDFIYVMSGKELHKISCENGKILQSADTVSTPSFGYTPSLVSEEKVFCPLEDGTVQAFDTETMSAAWTYTDSLGGQALSPVAYDNGLIYTGFWNDEDADANYICLNASDGSLKWSITRNGGFYWSEPAFCGDYIILGGDNGSGDNTAAGSIMLINKQTGEIADTLEIHGDVRSGITSYNGDYYSVTKAGYIYKISVGDNGMLMLSDSRKLPGASTSTPVIYNDKIYIGVQSAGFNGSICVLSADNFETVSTVEMNGYPQSEVLLTTAYDNVYVCSTYNAPPGGISVISDGKYTVSDLYIPEEGFRGYCISPLTVTDDGTLIYKNDSGTLFAVGKKEEEPQKTFFDLIADFFKSIISMIMSIFK